MRQLSRSAAILLLAVGGNCAASAEQAADVDDTDDDALALAAALPAPEESDEIFAKFKALRTKHGSIASLFAAYNRFQDRSKSDGVQALGNQEVRALLKDIGLGNLAIRGELAKLAIRAMDASGDGRVSEQELGVGLEVIDCWQAADTSREAFEILHSCAPAVAAWWQGGWFERLRAEERRFPIIQQALALASEEECERALLDKSLVYAQGPSPLHAGPTALRKALRQAGIGSLLLRHFAAAALIDGLDTDGNRKLSASELNLSIQLTCQAYGSVRARGTSLAAVLRALSLPTGNGGFTPDAFVDALHADQAARALDSRTLELARDAIHQASVARQDAAQPLELSPSSGVAVAAAFVRLAPEQALLAAGAPGSGTTSTRDEL